MNKDPYRVLAHLYDLSVGSLNTSVKRERRRVAPPIPGNSVLDIGCGTGTDLQMYAQAGCDVHGVDVSPAMLRVARRRFGETRDLRLCSAVQLPFEDRYFDLVLTSYTLHEMPPELRPAVIMEMIRVLKPNGRILLTDYLSGPYRFPEGWLNTMIIHIFERLAGGAHYRNGRDFLRRGGLLGLVNRSSLHVEKRCVQGGGTIGIILLHKGSEP